MRFEPLAVGLVLLMFSIGIEFFPDVFNIGSIIGVALFLIVVGIFGKEKCRKDEQGDKNVLDTKQPKSI